MYLKEEEGGGSLVFFFFWCEFLMCFFVILLGDFFDSFLVVFVLSGVLFVRVFLCGAIFFGREEVRRS